jgi:hypothetical protein
VREIAKYEGKPTPTLCPRITLRLTDSPLAEHVRKAGQGTVDQIHSDLEVLESLGAEYVLLDTYAGNPEQTLNPEKDWTMLSLLAERVIDLEHQALR